MPHETLDKIVKIVRVPAIYAKAKYSLLVPDAMHWALISDIEVEEVIGSSKKITNVVIFSFLAVAIVKRLCYIISKMTNSK